MMILRALCVALAIFCGAIGSSSVAVAQAESATTGSDAPAGSAGAAALQSKPGEFANGATQAAEQIRVLLGSLIPSAIATSAGVMNEANKFAWGLGVISLVLVGVRFAGTHHPVSAWVNLFEEVAILGIFVALYLGYTTTASGFWTWFEQLAANISGGNNGSTGAAMAKLAGTIFEAIKSKFGLGSLLNLGGTLADIFVLVLAAFFMCLASIVFVYFSAVGQIQAAIGIVLGPIALALGFSSYTRNYFVKWLDWMISAGMYVVIVAILIKLVGNSITNAVTAATNVGGSTTVNGAYVFDLSIFILLLSFEIPKLATIFGGGANATGTGALKLLRGAL
ncbi:type IV secretion system protein [Caballeronia sp. J97]|uniref:type IV secretion system protein n=1 Tax=Caballeronia sp. J97 TaxID=2805429 RepID=UPI002AB08694|nr:type IV secretion system protein [Caballeronia sp. J97]